MLSKVAEHIPPYFEPKKTNKTRLACNLFPFRIPNFYTNALTFSLRKKSIQFNNITDYETDTYFNIDVFGL